MSNNVIFNIAVCVMGTLLLLVHIVDLIIKKNKRKDEKILLLFITFTVFHFLLYLIFTWVRIYHSSNTLIICAYTLFYIANNVEVFLLVVYTQNCIYLSNRLKKQISLINLILFSIFGLLVLVNTFTGIFFYAKNGEYVRSNTMFIAQIYQFAMLGITLFIIIINKQAKLREKIAFAFYCILPAVAMIIQNMHPGYAFAYASIIVDVEVLFFFINVQKNIELAKEEEKNKEAQIRIMLSQIQPHFMYNSLSAISTLITIDPEKAQNSLDDFTEYLRRNLSSLTENNLIPFRDELRHIETYVSLEKMRFNERINVIYDIGVKDFSVPTLSVQPLVENAIKHGILKRIEGGNVTLTTYETNLYYIIEIKDDGVGFDINKINFEENKHFGLKNISYRISQMCAGSDVNVSSKINIGTKITIKLKK